MKDKLLKYFLYFAIFSIISGSAFSIPLGGNGSDIGVNIYTMDISAILLTIFWLFNIRDFYNLIKRDNVAKSFLLFIFITFLSLVFTPALITLPHKILSSLYIIRIFSYFSIYISVRHLLAKNKISTSRFIYLLTVSGITLAIAGWLQYFLYPDLRNLYYLGWDPHYKRIFSTILDPNYLGLILVLTFVALFSSLPRPLWKKDTKIKIFSLIPSIFIFFTIMFTYSRSAFSSFLTAAAYYSLAQKKYIIIGGCVIILFLAAFLLPKPGGEGVNLKRLYSIQERLINWQEGLGIFLKYPLLGIGFDTLRYTNPNVKNTQLNNTIISQNVPNHSAGGLDNSLIFVAATTGILGLTAYLLFLIMAFNKSILVSRISLLAIFVHSLFLNSLFFPPVLIWLWVILGLSKGKGDF
ncbi:O-antigen ligase family protein [Patescibacteria group bacterium]|nr:O-antigen ligase family protein [Patescibacteria group bacterium]